MNALIATTSEYTRLKTGKRLDGMMFHAQPLEIKWVVELELLLQAGYYQPVDI